MAALSALLKTWVILQTLCLALAQVVSGRGRLGPAQFGICLVFWGSVGIGSPGKGQQALNVSSWCSQLCAALCAG